MTTTLIMIDSLAIEASGRPGACGRSVRPRSVRFDSPRRPTDHLTRRQVVPARGELRQVATQALEADLLENLQPRFGRLVAKLVRMVKEGGREPVLPPVRISVLTGLQVGFGYRQEIDVEEEASGQPVEQRREPADRGQRHQAARASDSTGLADGGQAIGSLGQVVEGTKHQYGVEAVVREVQTPGVAQLGHHTLIAQRRIRGFDMPGCDIHDVDLIAIGGEPRGVYPGRTADVEDMSRRGGKVAAKHLLGPHQLQLAEPRCDALFLAYRFVVADHRLIEPIHSQDDTQLQRRRPGISLVDGYSDRTARS